MSQAQAQAPALAQRAGLLYAAPLGLVPRRECDAIFMLLGGPNAYLRPSLAGAGDRMTISFFWVN